MTWPDRRNHGQETDSHLDKREDRTGLFVVDLDGAMIGQITLCKGTGHGPPAAAGKAELGYLFLPQAWGFGYAAQACAAALGWFADALPGEPVVLFTQTANLRSMRLAQKLGFAEVQRFEAYGAEQWFGIWSSVTRFQTPAMCRGAADHQYGIPTYFVTKS